MEEYAATRDRIRGRRGVRLKAFVYLAAASLALTACAPGNSPQEGGEDAPQTAAEYYLPENAALYAPEDAELVAPTGGPESIGPITGQTLTPGYAEALPVPEGPIGDPSKTYNFCFSQGLANNPWSTAQKESLMIEAARHPNIEIQYTETNDPSQQVAQIESCVSRGVDGILVFPHSVGPLTPAIEAVCASGTFIIGMERTVDTDCYNSWIFLDYRQGAIDIAHAIGEYLDGEGIVVETQGTMGSSPQILRHEGFVATLETDYPDITLYETSPGEFDRTAAYESALSFLQSPQGSEIDAWYAQYSEMSLGIRAAMEQTGRTDIPLFTWGDDKSTIAEIMNGNVVAAVPPTPLHADVALRIAIRDLQDEEYPKYVMLEQPALLTAENAEEYGKTTWGSAE